ncbi:MAG: ribonuclease HIII [Simkaniaceae bacterium]|nr:ribonuclease HIII [Simkaniaceae bacterium]
MLTLMTEEGPFVTVVDPALADELRKALIEKEFLFTCPPHTLFRASQRGVSCTLYESGKLVIQGKEKGELIRFCIEPILLRYAPLDMTPRIGVDEAGKGDVFGPLCIGAVFASEGGIGALFRYGVKDSKSMTDKQILSLVPHIEKECKTTVIRLFPEKYNELYAKFRNLNTLLGWGHATVIETLVKETGSRRVIIDRFAKESVVATAIRRKGLEVDLTQRHGGEGDIVVAAASIIARAAFVKGMDALSRQFALELPKGASSRVVQAGRRFVRERGARSLPLIAKMHFKTLGTILA